VNKGWVIAVSVVFLAACGSSAAPAGGGSGGGAAKASASGSAAAAAPDAKKTTKSRKGEPQASDADKQQEVVLPKVEFQETDFAETERSRDPFRPYAEVFMAAAKSKVRSQLHVVAKQYSLDELRLVGIVSRLHPPRAMFVDPRGVGYVVDHGDFVGRPEIVQGGTTSADYEIHWRVDRVRDSDVVMVREDPSNPDVPSATRVVPLHTDDVIEPTE
jgi:type IV pilus assembly protein PilP